MVTALPRVYPRQQPLVEGRLVRRYKRFLADVELAGGEVVTAHCVNTGAMEGLTRPGNRVWLSRADNPKRKLAFTWELVETQDGRLFGCNTGFPNRLVKRLLAEGALPWLRGYPEIRPEQRYGENSRVDFHLIHRRRELYLEVKNCHLVYPDGRAYFPDAVSQRATGHLRDLAAVIQPAIAGQRQVRAEVLFTCQMPGVKAVRPSDAHDPEFASTARQVKAQGVGFAAIEVLHTPETVTVTRRLPVSLAPYGVKRVARWRREARSGSSPERIQ
jgi:sugar fermentation stimulation protein A